MAVAASEKFKHNIDCTFTYTVCHAVSIRANQDLSTTLGKKKINACPIAPAKIKQKTPDTSGNPYHGLPLEKG